MLSTAFAVTPLVLAPVTVLLMLLPALAVEPLRWLRGWWPLLNVCVVNLTWFVVCIVFTGMRKRFWWAQDVPLWSLLAFVALAGTLWVWYRQPAGPGGRPSLPLQGVLLGVMTGVCAGFALWYAL
jgi:hypothetical protein